MIGTKVLCELGDDKAVKRMERLIIPSGDRYQRIELARSLGTLGVDEALPSLSRLVEDPDRSVRFGLRRWRYRLVTRRLVDSG